MGWTLADATYLVTECGIGLGSETTTIYPEWLV